MALVALVTSVVAINVKGWVAQERFRSSVAVVQDACNVAQELMLLANTDCDVQILRDKDGGWEAYLRVMEPLPAGLAGLLQQRRQLPGLRDIGYLDHESQRRIDPIVLSFASRGSRMPRGILTLEGEREQRQIVLLGYPARVKVGGTQEELNWQAESEELYPNDIQSPEAAPVPAA